MHPSSHPPSFSVHNTISILLLSLFNALHALAAIHLMIYTCMSVCVCVFVYILYMCSVAIIIVHSPHSHRNRSDRINTGISRGRDPKERCEMRKSMRTVKGPGPCLHMCMCARVRVCVEMVLSRTHAPLRTHTHLSFAVLCRHLICPISGVPLSMVVVCCVCRCVRACASRPELGRVHTYATHYSK